MTEQVENKLKILLVTQWFDPEPTFKGLTFAKALQARGHTVSVVTGFPNYPGGQIYPGYRLSMLKRETIEGLKINRVFLYPSHGDSKLGRILNYLSFFLSSLLFLLFLAPRSDVIYAYHPPATTGMAVAITRFFRRTPTVLDIQDMWPDTLRATGMLNNERALSFIGTVCKWIYRSVDHIVVLSPGFKKLLCERGVREAKIDVIPNWSDELPIGNTNAPAWNKEKGTFTVLFSGNMGEAQGLEHVLEAAEMLQKICPNIRLAFLGSGVVLASLKAITKQKGLLNVQYLPRVLKSEVGAYLGEADCLLVHLRPDPLFAITIPSKTQSYLEAGKPIIMAVEGDAADMLRESGAGLSVTPGNPEDLASAIAKLAVMSAGDLERMGENGKNYYWEKLCLARGVEQFDIVFQRLACNI